MMRFLRKLWSNISTIITAFIFAIIVWVSSVVSADPNINADYSHAIPVQVIGLADDKTLVGGFQE
ncbi:MAG: hypothetical protein KAR20_28160, partial [Candidatus Heimdallarchaeota archaeon]|nr:hypothetical protein [Candidatus Heimdallarchaeota archaeon]